jgi:hypothetical protein
VEDLPILLLQVTVRPFHEQRTHIESQNRTPGIKALLLEAPPIRRTSDDEPMAGCRHVGVRSPDTMLLDVDARGASPSRKHELLAGVERKPQFRCLFDAEAFDVVHPRWFPPQNDRGVRGYESPVTVVLDRSVERLDARVELLYDCEHRLHRELRGEDLRLLQVLGDENVRCLHLPITRRESEMFALEVFRE